MDNEDREKRKRKIETMAALALIFCTDLFSNLIPSIPDSFPFRIHTDFGTFYGTFRTLKKGTDVRIVIRSETTGIIRKQTHYFAQAFSIEGVLLEEVQAFC